MDYQTDLRVIASLTPLNFAHKASAGDSAAKQRVKFVISFSGYEPFLHTEADNLDPADMTLADRELFREINRISSTDSFDVTWDDAPAAISLWKYPFLLPLLCANGSLYFNSEPIDFDPDSHSALFLRLFLFASDAAVPTYTPSLELRYQGEFIANPLILNDEYLLCGTRIFRIRSIGSNFASISSLLHPFTHSRLEGFLSIFLSYFSNITPEIEGVRVKFTDILTPSLPTIIFEKVAADQALYMRVTQTADGFEGNADLQAQLSRVVVFTDANTLQVRNVDLIDPTPYANHLEEMLKAAAPNRTAVKALFRDDLFFIVPQEIASPFLYTYLPQVLQEFKLLGSDKLKEYKVAPVRPKLNLRLSSGIDFLEGEANVDLGEQSFTLAELLAQYNRNRYIQLNDGNRAIIDDKFIKRLQRLLSNKDKDGHIKVSIFDLPEVEDLINSKVTGPLATRTRQIFEGLNALKSATLPKLQLNATLRPYQREGVKWIKYLYDNNLGGCLADDMGLGKTVQTIGVLTQLYPQAERPTLIVMPRSLLFNWQQELKKFAPQLSVATYYGSERFLDEALNAQIILTTYAMVRNDIEKLRTINWQYIILDESQNIKNLSSQISQAVMLLEAEHRLALSGTPMENNLTELYSLFRFLNPTMFGTLDDFNALYANPIQRTGDKDAMQSLRRKIFPFMLRRLKSEVLKDLPDRIEQTNCVEMSAEQARLYNQRRLYFREQIEKTIHEQGVAKSQFVMFQALNELRQIASIPENFTDGTIHSPKIEAMVEAIESAVNNGHKTVVFFNFLAGIELLGNELRSLGIDFERMDGSTTANRRKQIVERFQTDPDCMVLLMTLKVGGVGLNLTAADTVFIAEPWWNKAAEEQAINRLHRIGQKNVVNAYSMITAGTIEEKILELQQHKKELFDGLIEADTSSAKQLSEEDINFILS